MSNSAVMVGHGPRKVICLNGWFGSAEGWGPFVDALDPSAFSYVFMDYRGYGGSRQLTGNYSIAEIAQDVLALADQLDWPYFSLIGHSMGGSAIQHVLADAPERVKALVAITPVPASGVPFDEAGWALFSSAAGDPAARRVIVDMSTGGKLGATWIDKVVRHSLQNATEAAFAGYLQAWAKTDFAHRINGLAHPVQVIVGGNDPALTAEVMAATWLRAYPQGQLEVIASAGHYPMDETPLLLASLVERFLTKFG